MQRANGRRRGVVEGGAGRTWAARTRRWWGALMCAAAVAAGGCSDGSGAGDEPDTGDADADAWVASDPLGLDLVVAADAGAGLQGAALDVIAAWAAIKGQSTQPAEHIVGSLEAVDAAEVVVVRVEADADAALGEEGYRIAPRADGRGLDVIARTEVGAMYGLYELVGALGVRYLHPEETFYPSDPQARLPQGYTGAIEAPAFAQRGFHEHTQHPIVMSDFLMRPGDAGWREHVTRYIRWLARNRQNAFSFHALKTIEMDAWLPYIDGIADEADAYGVDVGVVFSFADQQQNCLKLINDEPDPLTGEVAQAAVQIREGLDRMLEADFDFIVLQIGTSEFTKPSDAEALGWMEVAVEHLRAAHPGVGLYTWIHIFCGSEAESGGYYYHLPLQADADIGAWVHTTMFYTLSDPAPVYDCQDFTHQIAFMRAADGEREQVFFPETAWWLGFDNNMPLVLPITGWSRARDVERVLADHEVRGHMTFTTGREWTYWQYDHHLTRLTWEGDTTWEAYLAWIAPLYGAQGEAVVEALTRWTALQVQHLYEENPEIYFYLAGELTQDEIGERAGILARRPKLAYRRVLEMDEAAFEAWRARDLEMLRAMGPQYQAVLDGLPAALEGGTPQQRALYAELRAGLEVYVQRIAHAVALYEGVVAARGWWLEQAAARSEGREPDAALRDAALGEAQARLGAARAITEAVQATITEAEGRYRYGLDVLVDAKPGSLTSYPFGYLHETSTAHFWRRRDDQLERLYQRVFDESDDAWLSEPDVLYVTNGRLATMREPSDVLAASVITAFVPQLLFGLSQIDLEAGTMTLIVAEDHNENLLPDPATELSVSGAFAGATWTGSADAFNLIVHDDTDTPVGTLSILDATFTLEAVIEGARLTDLASGGLTGELTSASLIELITSVGGIDQGGAENLVKQIYDVPLESALPERLPLAFEFRYEAAQ